MSTDDNKYIQLCFDLALMAQGHTSPNPLVGSVIVKNGKIIGQGYHKRAGAAHAEVEAIKDAESKGYNVKNSILYCNLEPCCHLDKKTPPCVDLLIKKKLKKVILSNLDPNPEVAGQGVKKLRDAGVEVICGVLEKKGAEINRVFFHCMREKRPYVHLKLAQTLDGKIATLSGDSKWISSEKARIEVHELRKKYDSVAVGSQTVANDDPQLTIRMGVQSEGKTPKRIVFGSLKNIETQRKLFTDKYKSETIIVTAQAQEKSKEKSLAPINIIYAKKNELGQIDLKDALEKLFSFGVCSILVEGGTTLLTSFIQSGLYERLTVYIAPKLIGSGISFYETTKDNTFKMDQALKLKTINFRKIDNQIVWDLEKEN